MRENPRQFAWMLGVALLLLGCGEKRPSESGDSPRKPRVEAAFLKAAEKYKLPVRMLMAVGYLESRLASERSSAVYKSQDPNADRVERGTVMTETAFGLTFDELCLDPETKQDPTCLDPLKEDSRVLETQIDAYARWLSAKVSDGYLPRNPKTQDEKYEWIKALADLHRRGEKSRQNVRIIFARELIEVLNKGFLWQDPRDGQRLEFGKEKPPINIDEFPVDARGWFELTEWDVQESDLAMFLPLGTYTDGEENHPRRVVVIHCPLSLSGCLKLQESKEDNDAYVYLETHYLIPPIDADALNRPMAERVGSFNKAIQVAKHRHARVITNSQGEPVAVQDAVVITLVGNSGRNVAGERRPADPTWFTDAQLKLMGRLIDDVCRWIVHKDKSVKLEECLGTEGDLGVQFQHRGASEEYRWGDIADFDETIFNAYVRNRGGLGSQVAFEFPKDNRRFKAGDVKLTVLLDRRNARTVNLERLMRCRSGKVVWVPVEIEEVRGERRITFNKQVFGAGPNGNGDHFFRARVYDKDGKLIGWAIDRIYLSKFDEGIEYAAEDHCGA